MGTRVYVCGDWCSDTVSSSKVAGVGNRERLGAAEQVSVVTSPGPWNPALSSTKYKVLNLVLTIVRKMTFSIKVFVTFLDYLKILQATIIGDLHV
jgi:hypothetical protein